MKIFDASLERSIEISLFSDRGLEGIQGGYWADTSMGSLLPLLKRRKINKESLNESRDMAYKALSWLLDKKIIDQLLIDVSRDSIDSIVIAITIKKQNEQKTYNYRM